MVKSNESVNPRLILYKWLNILIIRYIFRCKPRNVLTFVNPVFAASGSLL